MATQVGEGRPSKRRPGASHGGLPVADPRPALDGSGADAAVLGVRCTACRYPAAQSAIPWCPVCYAPVEQARFAVTGTVWSSTVVAIPVGDRRPPFGLAYLDLDDGPRVMVHLSPPVVVEGGRRARITGTDQGDLVAEPDQGETERSVARPVGEESS